MKDNIKRKCLEKLHLKKKSVCSLIIEDFSYKDNYVVGLSKERMDTLGLEYGDTILITNKARHIKILALVLMDFDIDKKTIKMNVRTRISLLAKMGDKLEIQTCPKIANAVFLEVQLKELRRSGDLMEDYLKPYFTSKMLRPIHEGMILHIQRKNSQETALFQVKKISPAPFAIVNSATKIFCEQSQLLIKEKIKGLNFEYKKEVHHHSKKVEKVKNFVYEEPEEFLKKSEEKYKEEKEEEEMFPYSEKVVEKEKNFVYEEPEEFLKKGEEKKKEEEEKEDDDLFKVSCKDIGGLEKQLKEIKELILSIRHPILFNTIGIRPPRAILIHGPSGTGKTLIGRTIGKETNVSLNFIKGHAVMSFNYIQNVQRLFKFLLKRGVERSPVILFFDNLDLIAPKFNGVDQIISQFRILLDEINFKSKYSRILVIATTNDLNSINSSIRRRFDREIGLTIPDAKGRLDILKIHAKNMKMDKRVDLQEISSKCPGFSGADIAQLCSEAGFMQIQEKTKLIDTNQEIEDRVLSSLAVTMHNFQAAIAKVKPGSLRDLHIEVPKVTWKDVGGLDSVKKELKETIEYPLKYTKIFEKFGIKTHGSILFYGPPGCGKTLIAKAIANEFQVNFISVNGPELLTMWFGESEANVRDIFVKARSSAPSILFFDELDSIAKRRDDFSSSDNAADRVINQILTEMDGVQNDNKNVFIIGATNRPDVIDPAILRPGRFDQLIYIPLPDELSRHAIFKANLRNTPVSKNVDLKWLAQRTSGYSGADLSGICQQASLLALRRSIEFRNPLEDILNKNPDAFLFGDIREVTNEDFEASMRSSRKSVTESQIKKYEQFGHYRGFGNNIRFPSQKGENEYDEYYDSVSEEDSVTELDSVSELD